MGDGQVVSKLRQLYGTAERPASAATSRGSSDETIFPPVALNSISIMVCISWLDFSHHTLADYHPP